MSGIITLTTDFGISDSYVGTMKGVILGIAPDVRLVDITHAIAPQGIHQAAYIVQSYYTYFPNGTIHVVVVDPGVGSARRLVALRTPRFAFVAPDNGVLTYIWRDALAAYGREQLAVHEVTERRYWRETVSNTFHGRDVIAPVAAHLAAGIDLALLGPALDAPIEASLDQPRTGRSGELIGKIIHLDNFGNCVSNITRAHLRQAAFGERVTVHVIGQRIPGVLTTYAEAGMGELLALFGSSDRLEIAVRNGNAAQTLGAGVGDVVKVFRGA